jgi:hypothetical protein
MTAATERYPRAIGDEVTIHHERADVPAVVVHVGRVGYEVQLDDGSTVWKHANEVLDRG